MNFPMVPPVAINESQEHGKSYLGKIKIKKSETTWAELNY